MRYDEIQIELRATPNGFVTRVSGTGPAATEDPFVPLDSADAAAIFEDWFDLLEQDPPDLAAKTAFEARRRKIGESLFLSVFASAAPLVRAQLAAHAMQAALGAQSGLRLRLVLGNADGRGEVDANAILPASCLPHELMADPQAIRRFVARDRLVSIVRTLGQAEVVKPIAVLGQLRVLVVSAQPEGLAQLAWEKEAAAIQAALKERTDTRVEVLEHASFEAVCERLAEGFHVLHFIGHGGFDADLAQWTLVFEKEKSPQRVPAEDLSDRFGSFPMLRLAVINACHSGELAARAGADAMSGIAAAISVAGVPAVVAMQVAVTDSAATTFSSAFYGALREGRPVEAAVADGRTLIRIASPEWATPVLYLRGQTSDLFEFMVSSAAVRRDSPDELRLGIRTLVASDKFPHLADWAKRLATTTDRLLALEEYFTGRFVKDRSAWNASILPRLERFLAAAVDEGRPLSLNLAAHGTVAFAAGYYLHVKQGVKVTLRQVTAVQTLRWSADVGACPAGPLWEPFSTRELNPDFADVAVAVEVTQGTAAAAADYVAASGAEIGCLVVARIAGGPGNLRVESGAHAHQLALKLQQWLKDHTGDRSRRRLHFFIAAPNGFQFFFGQLAVGLGPLRLYEYDFEGTYHATYEPALDLPPAPAPEEGLP